MSDFGRKDFSDKAQEKLTPESQKSATDKISESATGAYDKAASAVQPEGDKSIGQNVSDTLGGTTKPGEKTYVQQAQDAAVDAGNYVKDTANSLLNTAADQTKTNTK